MAAGGNCGVRVQLAICSGARMFASKAYHVHRGIVARTPKQPGAPKQWAAWVNGRLAEASAPGQSSR